MSEGIVCKVWNISATQKKGSNLQLGDSINYILDKEVYCKEGKAHE